MPTRSLAHSLICNLPPLFVLAWLILFLGFFYRFELSTTPINPETGQRISRLDVWFAVPDLLSSAFFPDSPNQPSIFWPVWLGDRLPVIGVAALIACSALGYGYLSLRLMGLSKRGRVGIAHQDAGPGTSVGGAHPTCLRGAERLFFAYGIGAAFLSLVTLAAGLAGFVGRLAFLGFLLLGVIGGLGLGVSGFGFRVNRRPSRRLGGRGAPPTRLLAISPARPLALLAATPFLLLVVAGAMLPPLEFDVKEYHLEGPKEFYQQGRVTFLPHNVYANMPMGTEMLSLLAMVVAGDWWKGALAGKLVLSFFVPLGALGIGAAGSRMFNPTAGALGALIYLTTPWTYQLGTVAFVEGGMAFYVFAAVYAVALAGCSGEGSLAASRGRLLLLAGLMAGSAAACKYPGAVYVALPLFFAAATIGIRRGRAGEGTPIDHSTGSAPPGAPRATSRGGRYAAAFLLGAAVTFGPWLAKNATLAGNPTYPLFSSVLGGRSWDAQKARKWLRVHTSSTFTPRELGAKLLDVAVRSDLQSPLVFGLLPLAFVAAATRRRALWFLAYVGFVTVAWWLFTHRFDRFWIPVLPVAALLAGVGATWSRAGIWKLGLAGGLAVALVFNLALCTMAGYSKYTLPLQYSRVDPDRVKPAILAVNRQLPAEARLLVVGEAAVFDFERPIFYNTAFDDVLFEKWTRGKTPEQIRETFAEIGITHVYVDWNEIARYRSPGNYGYTDYVTPDVFRQLVREGVLDSGQPIGTGQELYAVRR